jgi:adenosylcobinamide-phosphate synthase
MSFFSLLAVFILEQIQPLPYRRLIRNPIEGLAAVLSKRFNAGQYQHGMLATIVVLMPLLGGLLLLYLFLNAINPILAWSLNVLVLYLTMGFRQFSHHYTEILLALRNDDLPLARQLLAEWRYANGVPAPEKLGLEQSEEIARESIELALLGAHRHVFAVLLWFVILPGPIGAVLYRVTTVLAEAWEHSEAQMGSAPSDFPLFARRLFNFLDWLPARATAAAFAIVGNFEDAVFCARTELSDWSDEATGIILASAAGALGVRLSTRVPLAVSEMPDGLADFDAEIADRHDCDEPFGQVAGVDFMQSAIGLVWRATVLWVLLLFLLGLASLFG